MNFIQNFNLCLSLSFFSVPSPLHLVLCLLPPVQYQMEMMRSLRHVNIDHLHVGWYQSTYYGSFVSRALLDSQFSYQHAIEESVVLIYGKQQYSTLIPLSVNPLIIKPTLYSC